MCNNKIIAYQSETTFLLTYTHTHTHIRITNILRQDKTKKIDSWLPIRNDCHHYILTGKLAQMHGIKEMKDRNRDIEIMK